MAATLAEMLLTPDVKPRVVDDCYNLIGQEVSEKSGVSGAGIKIGYKAATAAAPGHVRHLVDAMLPELAAQLEPYWADFNASGGADFGDYLAKNGDAVAEALLSVSDARAEASNRTALIKAYKTVRGGASKHIKAALPQLGTMIQKYAF